MVILFITLSIIFTVLLLVLSFENIAAQCNYLQFFFTAISATSSVTFIVLTIAFLGVLTGMSYAALIWSLFRKTDDENDDEY
ncbi:hypothetical protein A2335_00370 [Candidatus Peregrinibacteria bacterium RIFOXYB2_FULL_32_7]|nr:MAG: hypothetical protein A2335_00370 [Candidatus Peregrinibacteria bacterium RIFOXYB2_FULL_32_7]